MNVTDLIMNLQEASEVAKSRTGFLIARASMITILGKQAFQSIGLLNRRHTSVCLGSGALGLLNCLMAALREP
jgi:hypothetical protein